MNSIYPYDKIWDELKLPECINGKLEKNECPKHLKDPVLIIETSRRCQDLYHTVVNARFNFALSCADKYPKLLADNSDRNILTIKGLFLNSAILWYNNTFDHLLQVLWVYYELFSIKGIEANITTDTIDMILSKCKYDSVLKVGEGVVNPLLLKTIKDLYDTSSYSQIRLWANTIKHRSCLEYADLLKKDFAFISVVCDGEEGVWEAYKKGGKEVYNSMKAKQGRRVLIKDVSQSLYDYHKNLIEVIDVFHDCLYDIGNNSKENATV